MARVSNNPDKISQALRSSTHNKRPTTANSSSTEKKLGNCSSLQNLPQVKIFRTTGFETQNLDKTQKPIWIEKSESIKSRKNISTFQIDNPKKNPEIMNYNKINSKPPSPAPEISKKPRENRSKTTGTGHTEIKRSDTMIKKRFTMGNFESYKPIIPRSEAVTPSSYLSLNLLKSQHEETEHDPDLNNLQNWGMLEVESPKPININPIKRGSIRVRGSRRKIGGLAREKNFSTPSLVMSETQKPTPGTIVKNTWFSSKNTTDRDKHIPEKGSSELDKDEIIKNLQSKIKELQKNEKKHEEFPLKSIEKEKFVLQPEDISNSSSKEIINISNSISEQKVFEEQKDKYETNAYNIPDIDNISKICRQQTTSDKKEESKTLMELRSQMITNESLKESYETKVVVYFYDNFSKTSYKGVFNPNEVCDNLNLWEFSEITDLGREFVKYVEVNGKLCELTPIYDFEWEKEYSVEINELNDMNDFIFISADNKNDTSCACLLVSKKNLVETMSINLNQLYKNIKEVKKFLSINSNKICLGNTIETKKKIESNKLDRNVKTIQSVFRMYIVKDFVRSKMQKDKKSIELIFEKEKMINGKFYQIYLWKIINGIKIEIKQPGNKQSIIRYFKEKDLLEIYGKFTPRMLYEEIDVLNNEIILNKNSSLSQSSSLMTSRSHSLDRREEEKSKKQPQDSFKSQPKQSSLNASKKPLHESAKKTYSNISSEKASRASSVDSSISHESLILLAKTEAVISSFNMNVFFFKNQEGILIVAKDYTNKTKLPLQLEVDLPLNIPKKYIEKIMEDVLSRISIERSDGIFTLKLNDKLK